MTALHRIDTFAPPPTAAATQPPPKTVPPAHVGQGVTPLPLPTPQAAAPGRWRRFWQGRGATLLMGALSIASVLLFWQLATQYKLDAYIRFNNIPTPAQVLEKVVEVNSSPKFATNIGISVRRILLGFLVATVTGVGLGVLVGRYRSVRGLVMPAMEVFRPIPAIAWVPMSIMLWPDNEVSIVFITFLGAFFPILLNTVHGVEAIDPVLLRAARTLGAGEASLLRHVVLPGALPHIFTGLAVGMGVAWVSLIAAEMISGQFGIGYFTWEAYSLISYAEIALGMITIGVLGLLCSGAIRLLAKLAMPWHS
ncbi:MULTISPECIES: ABC transporter permease [Roseateles]|uniref:NitT/TauT family transport system permease protein n=1 Tax=Pelomonas aquatica TaxID=431058 RepID=A0ABU1Z6I0_9BURK|nr:MULTISPECIES: ABC transporter permease [Roseateles]KQY81554.1 ABC transporter permease [Pelomonas sp. Root1444]MDR7296234.1 NitT/TauT family transport system permease protein [Pelomonas aquatica]